MRVTREFLDELKIMPRCNASADMVVLGLLSKSIVLNEAVISLVKNKFPEEAFGLCRTSVEVSLTIRYLTNKETIKRCKRFYEYFAKDQAEWIKIITKYYPNYNLDNFEMPDKIEELASKYQNPHKWSECENGLRDFALEPSEHERGQDGKPSNRLFTYEVTYKLMSHYVHGTIMCLDPEHAAEPGSVFRVRDQMINFSKGAHAIRTSTLCVYLNIHDILRYLNTDVSQKLESEFQEFMKNFKSL